MSAALELAHQALHQVANPIEEPRLDPKNKY